jgi:polyisoprenoid-binding protein YceI
MRCSIRCKLLNAAAALVLAAPVAAGAETRTLVFDPAATDVSFELPATGHDVHGAIAVRRAEIRFDDRGGAASGEIILDAASAKSGNDTRDKTMREDVLEAMRFPEIRFVPERVEGALAGSGASEIRLIGKVFLHGAAHPLVMTAHVVAEGVRLSAESEFPVAFVDWGLKDPSFLFFRVEPVVKVRIVAKGELTPVAAAGGL